MHNALRNIIVVTANIISTLMHAVLQSSTASSKSASVPRVFTHDYYRQYGDLAFTELAELRHRGAFSTVSQTFTMCCLRCAESEDPETRALPKAWYKVGFSYLRSPAAANCQIEHSGMHPGAGIGVDEEIGWSPSNNHRHLVC